MDHFSKNWYPVLHMFSMSFYKRAGVACLMLVQLTIGSWAVNRILTTTPDAKAQTTINFAGRTWIVKSGYDGPGPNDWDDSPQSVFVDSLGRLHLRITYSNGKWYSSEVYLPGSLGYGTYRFDVDTPVYNIDLNTVAAAFVYQDDNHEIDVMEYSAWQEPGNWMGQFVVQPWSIAGNMKRFPTPSVNAPSTQMMQWTPTNINFNVTQNGSTLASWNYTGGNNFVPGREAVHLNHWLSNTPPAPANGQIQELIFRNFTFTPLSTTSTTTSTVTRPKKHRR